MKNSIIKKSRRKISEVGYHEDRIETLINKIDYLKDNIEGYCVYNTYGGVISYITRTDYGKEIFSKINNKKIEKLNNKIEFYLKKYINLFNI